MCFAVPCCAANRIEPGAVPELARTANPMTFGRWMEMKGIEAKGQRTSGGRCSALQSLCAHMLLVACADKLVNSRS